LRVTRPRRIAARNFNFTIGFAEIAPGWVGRGLTTQLRNIAAEHRVQYIHQGHFYPRTFTSWPRLSPVSSLPERFKQFPVIVGEFPTRFPADANDTWRCPEWKHGVHSASDEHEGERDEYLYARIRKIERLGYAGAFFWSLSQADLQSGTMDACISEEPCEEAAPAGEPDPSIVRADRENVLAQIRRAARGGRR
jgi:hypothetical protein